MANLRSLTNAVPVTAATNYPQEILIYNTSPETANNGGRCCLWTVPAGAVWVKFEMWGGGGGGAGACCCQQGSPGGSGAYAVKTICSMTLAGCQYTICAGGTTSMSPICVGCVGCDSYVTGYGLSNFCARGGAHGDTHCFYHFCNSCCIPWAYCCCAYGGDLCIHGNQSTYNVYNWCGQGFQQHAMLAGNTASGPRLGPGGCINGSPNGSCCNWFTTAYFPGGGAWSGQSIAGNCWCGGWGASGLVSVTYG